MSKQFSVNIGILFSPGYDSLRLALMEALKLLSSCLKREYAKTHYLDGIFHPMKKL